MPRTYRVYFNQHGDFPYVWSVDTGDGSPEINVKSISVIGKLTSHYRPERQPKAWLTIIGELEIVDGHAKIERAASRFHLLD